LTEFELGRIIYEAGIRRDHTTTLSGCRAYAERIYEWRRQ